MAGVLLSYVGEQDPISQKTHEEGSIVTLVRHIKPNLVYLFPTDDPTGVSSTVELAEKAKVHIETELKHLGPPVARIVKVDFDPVVFEDILGKMEKVLGSVLDDLNRHLSSVEVHVNLSSGTPQLKSSWLLLAMQGILRTARFWQVYNPKYSSRAHRVEEVHLSFLEERTTMDRIAHYTELGLYGVAASEAERLVSFATTEDRKGRASLTSQILQAYEYWDLLQLEEALSQLRQVLENNEPFLTPYIKETLGKQVCFLEKLISANGVENQDNLTDLYYNMLRRWKRSDYVDVVARFWRLHEGCLYYYARTKYQLDPQDVPGSQCSLLKCKLQAQGHTKAVLWELHKALGEVDEVYGELLSSKLPGKTNKYGQLKRVLEKLRNKRNDSVVAHGMKPLDKEDAELALESAKILLPQLIGVADSMFLQEYPFKPEDALRIVRDMLFAFVDPR